MAKPARAAETYFSHPVRQITFMLLVLLLVLAGGWLAYPRVSSVFLANVWLNGFIFLVFLIGVASCFLQVAQLGASVNWITGFAADQPGHHITIPPRLLAPLAALLRSRGRHSHISASSARSILESVATRIDEARDITRYIVNLLIFLGLLGTFYGLATTVPAVVETIRSLAPAGEESGLAVFDRLMTGLEAQLGGMGTAFSSSLLGLAGSLVVGLLELFAGQSQNRFYRELEEWLSSITRLGVASDGGEGEGPADLTTLTASLSRMAEHMEAMRDAQAEAEAGRAQLDSQMGQLAEAVERLAERAGAESETAAALARVAEGQERITANMEETAREGGGAAADAEMRMRLRSIDVQLLRILEELSAGRQESLTDLRSDIANLTRSVRQLSRGRAAVAPGPDEEG
ncbi:biopolymer transporter ExbB [Rhodobacteraceae bacterium WD3A24]|nr:biopolymer transporter ExbB [Rhodobacteraceae bacterium WD3A24]